MDEVKGIFFKDIENSYIAHIMKEMWMDKVYEPYLGGKTGLNVLDIGANVGIFSLFAYSHADRIIAVEPSKRHFSILNEMLKYNKMDKVIGVNAAIGAENGRSILHHSQNVTMYSLKAEVQDPNLEAEEVDVITFEKLMRENNMDHVDFLKLDIEGFEGEVFCGDDFAKMAPKIDSLVYEWHSWASVNPRIINAALEELGYKVTQMPTEATVFGAVRV